MHAHRSAPSSADVAAKASTVLAGLRVLKMALFPLALPGAVDPAPLHNAIATVLGDKPFRRRRRHRRRDW
jgi:hypothetical protein